MTDDAGNNFDDYESNTEPWNWYGYPPYPYYPYGSMTPPLWRAQVPGASASARTAQDTSEDDFSDADSTSTDLTPSEAPKQKYSYRLKIINPTKRSEFVIREVHRFNQRFATIQELKEKIMEEFSDQLPETMDYQVGYFHGKQSAKRWIMTQEDLNLMYESKKENILLWADARVQCSNTNGSSSRGQKRKAADPFGLTSKRQQIESEVDDVVSELKKKQGDKYTMPQLRLWARCIVSGNHESTDEPPDLPPITGNGPKKPRKQSLGDALMEAANTFAAQVRGSEIKQSGNAIVVSGSGAQTPTKLNTSVCIDNDKSAVLSPGKVTELRSKKLQELRELQCLRDQNILTEEEFAEQKGLVLASLRKLTH